MTPHGSGRAASGSPCQTRNVRVASALAYELNGYTLWSEFASVCKPPMTRNSQLLAHVVSKLTNRAEDAAVESMGFILSRSRAARIALRDVLEICVRDIGELTGAKTQVGGSDGARPDLVVYGHRGEDRALIEAKFWAELTENQPGSYLARLPADTRPSVLLFVSPEKRLESLSMEVLRRLEDEAPFPEPTKHPGIKCMQVQGGHRYILFTSWRLLLDRMLAAAIASADAIESDIRQLHALCDQQDSAAFLPIHPGEFAPAFPRRMLQLNLLIDDAVEQAKEAGIVNTDQLRKTPYPYGYGHYIKLGSERGNRWAGAWFGVNFELWFEFQETPLWLMFSSWPGVLPMNELHKAFGKDLLAYAANSIPLHLPTGLERDGVLAAIVEHLADLADAISYPPVDTKRRDGKPPSEADLRIYGVVDGTRAPRKGSMLSHICETINAAGGQASFAEITDSVISAGHRGVRSGKPLTRKNVTDSVWQGVQRRILRVVTENR